MIFQPWIPKVDNVLYLHTLEGNDELKKLKRLGIPNDVHELLLGKIFHIFLPMTLQKNDALNPNILDNIPLEQDRSLANQHDDSIPLT